MKYKVLIAFGWVGARLCRDDDDDGEVPPPATVDDVTTFLVDDDDRGDDDCGGGRQWRRRAAVDVDFWAVKLLAGSAALGRRDAAVVCTTLDELELAFNWETPVNEKILVDEFCVEAALLRNWAPLFSPKNPSIYVLSD